MSQTTQSLRVPEFSLIVAVNDNVVLKSSLLRSPGIADRCEIIEKRGFSSAGLAYNSGMAEASREILIFAHQDIYFPERWFDRLAASIEQLSARDPNWGVIGPYGVSTESAYAGHVYCTGLTAILGRPRAEFIEAGSLDEIVLIFRRSSGLKFDEKLPDFHLYGIDVCTEARSRGMKNYVIPAFCVHNSNGLRFLPRGFNQAFRYLREKWEAELPLHTNCAVVKKGILPLIDNFWGGIYRVLLRRPPPGVRCDNPEELYNRLVREGLEQPDIAIEPSPSIEERA